MGDRIREAREQNVQSSGVVSRSEGTRPQTANNLCTSCGFACNAKRSTHPRRWARRGRGPQWPARGAHDRAGGPSWRPALQGRERGRRKCGGQEGRRESCWGGCSTSEVGAVVWCRRTEHGQESPLSLHTGLGRKSQSALTRVVPQLGHLEVVVGVKVPAGRREAEGQGQRLATKRRCLGRAMCVGEHRAGDNRVDSALTSASRCSASTQVPPSHPASHILKPHFKPVAQLAHSLMSRAMCVGERPTHSASHNSNHNSNHPVGSLAHVQGRGALCSAGQSKVEGQAAAGGVRVGGCIGGGGGQVQSLIRGRGWRRKDGIRNEIHRRPWG